MVDGETVQFFVPGIPKPKGSMSAFRSASMKGDVMELQKCPCGETPIFLNIRRGFTEEMAIAEPVDCCDTWYINFNLDGCELYSKECVALAIVAWNKRPWGGGFYEYANT